MSTQKAVVESLSLHALRVELHRRNLPATGLKSRMRERLLQALDAGPGSTITVPRRFQAPKSLGKPSANGDIQDAEDIQDCSNHIKRRKVDVVGYVMHNSVWVTGANQMAAIWEIADGYGKGNLSRSQPVYSRLHPGPRNVAKNGRAARQLMQLEKSGAAEPMLDREDVEHLQLTLVEAFHGAFVAKKLRLVNGLVSAVEEEEPLDNELETWASFCTRDPLFAHKYAAYVRYRMAGWMPRSGLKYGVDWVLYSAGAKRHTHAPYCVVLAFGSKPIESTWIRLQNKLRLVKNVAKNLIAAQVLLPCTTTSSHPPSPQAAVDAVQVIELTIDRWVC